MRKKKVAKKHSVKANLQVVELTRAGSSLDLAIYADKEDFGTMIRRSAQAKPMLKTSREALPGED